MSEPTTDQVRLDYMYAYPSTPDGREIAGAEFDRWLAQYTAEVRAAALAEQDETEWEYGYRPTYAPMHPEHAGEPMPEIWPTNRTPDDFVPGMGGAYRRTKQRVTPAGPWMPVEQDTENRSER